jgi:hypothetical protein
MKSKNIIISALVALGLTGAVASSIAAEEKEEKPSVDIQAKVTDTIKAAYPDADITAITKTKRMASKSSAWISPPRGSRSKPL